MIRPAAMAMPRRTRAAAAVCCELAAARAAFAWTSSSDGNEGHRRRASSSAFPASSMHPFSRAASARTTNRSARRRRIRSSKLCHSSVAMCDAIRPAPVQDGRQPFGRAAPHQKGRPARAAHVGRPFMGAAVTRLRRSADCLNLAEEGFGVAIEQHPETVDPKDGAEGNADQVEHAQDDADDARPRLEPQ